MGLKNAKGSLIVFIIALIGCFSNQAGDVAFIIVPTIAAAIFIGLGRNPLAGILCGYASVGCGYGTEILPAFLSSVLTPVSVTAAQTVDPSFTMSPLSGYFTLVTSAVLVSIAVTFVTVKIVEPKFGKYDPANADESVELTVVEELTPQQRKSTKLAGLSLLIYILLIAVLCIPKNSFFRGEDGGLLTGSPLMNSVIGLLVLMFLIPGATYGILTKQITGIKDAAEIMYESVKSIAPFIVMAIIIGQFLALFTVSNLGTIIAIGGGELLKATGLPIQIVLVLFIILTMIVDVFMMSGSTKYLIFGPVFVPMFMQLNIHPALTQAAYRIGDCITNSLTPLNAAFLICVTMCQKYDKKFGFGNFFAAMISYSIAVFVVLVVMLVLWTFTGLPTGPTGGIWFK
jgi:aminobenzoyl-glutamate transport protein